MHKVALLKRSSQQIILSIMFDPPLWWWILANLILMFGATHSVRRLRKLTWNEFLIISNELGKFFHACPYPEHFIQRFIGSIGIHIIHLNHIHYPKQDYRHFFLYILKPKIN